MTASAIALAPIGRYPAYLFDLDGTLVYPDEAVPGAAAAIAALRAAGRAVAVVTNNSALSRAEVAAKLARLGFRFEPRELITALVAAGRYVAREHRGAAIHGQGSPGLRVELRAAGLRLVPPERAEVLVVGHDPRLTYHKLLRCTRALLRGAHFVAVNRDALIFSPAGALPAAGAAVAALEAASGRSPQVVIGKPGPLILQEAARSLGYSPADCVYVGDSLRSDIGAARAAGMAATLVLSGVTSRADLPAGQLQPDYLLASVAELAAQLT